MPENAPDIQAAESISEVPLTNLRQILKSIKFKLEIDDRISMKMKSAQV